ncbi:MAG: DUF2776 family protein [Candidatus Moranbacteria bacterium]|nr:DUF2776 family protein [Candidatus Moranbacteria bacterium]
MKKQTKKQKNRERQPDWLEVIKNWAAENAKDITYNLVRDTRERVRDFIHELFGELNRVLFSSLTVFMGLVFLMIGLAILINEVVSISNSLGYIMVGIVVILSGVMINKRPNQRQ